MTEAEDWNAKRRHDNILTTRARIKQQIAATAKDFGVTFNEVMSHDRSRRVCVARFAAIARVARDYPHFSYPQLGKLFKRDHTTIMNALARCGELSPRGRGYHSTRGLGGGGETSTTKGNDE